MHVRDQRVSHMFRMHVYNQQHIQQHSILKSTPPRVLKIKVKIRIINDANPVIRSLGLGGVAT
jgi:hypothetical protein